MMRQMRRRRRDARHAGDARHGARQEGQGQAGAAEEGQGRPVRQPGQARAGAAAAEAGPAARPSRGLPDLPEDFELPDELRACCRPARAEFRPRALTSSGGSCSSCGSEAALSAPLSCTWLTARWHGIAVSAADDARCTCAASCCRTASGATCGSTTRPAPRRRGARRADRRDRGWVLPGLVDAHCHVGLDEHGGVDEATSRGAGARRPRRRRAAAARRRRARRHALDRRPRRPAAGHPGRPAHRPDQALHPQLRRRDRAGRPGRRGRDAGRPAAATAGSSSSATGSTATPAT